MNPNAVEFSLLDDNKEIFIDGDYQVLEGHTQRTECTHVHLINLGDIKRNQIISAHISDQRSLLVNDFDEEHVQTNTNSGAPRATEGASTSQHSYATMLTFGNGVLVGGNYDIYDESDFTAGDGDAIDSNTNNDGGVFQDVLEDTHQRTIPTLIVVAQNMAHKEENHSTKSNTLHMT